MTNITQARKNDFVYSVLLSDIKLAIFKNFAIESLPNYEKLHILSRKLHGPLLVSGRRAGVHVAEMSQAAHVVRRCRRRLADVPIAECRTAGNLGSHLRTRGHRNASRRRRIRFLAVTVVMRRRSSRTAVHLHVLSERRRMGVRFITTCHPAIVRFVGRVNVRMFLPVRRIRKSTITAFVFALERFFTCNRKEKIRI